MDGRAQLCHGRRPGSLWLLGVFAAATCAACAGAIDDPGVPSTGMGGAAGGAAGGTGKGGSAGSAVNCTPSKKIASGPAPLRRLTKVEYDNTVADLLGDNSKPSAGFAREAKKFGFDNIASVQVVTSELAGNYLEAAEALAGRAAQRLDTLAPCDPTALGEESCARKFIADFGKRAYRRPLTAAQAASLLSMYTLSRKTEDHKTSLTLIIQRLLMSPYFLYRPEIAKLSSWNMASRLSYLLWSTMPDPVLFDAAQADALKTPEQIMAQARRMLDDAKAHASVARFHEGWLDLDQLDKADKDDGLYPGYDAKKPAMREEIERFVDDAFWQGDSSLDRFFNADYTYMTKDLATYLKLPGASTMAASFARVSLAGTGMPQSTQRIGILTTAGILSAHSKPLETSPILRGKFIVDQIVCAEVPAPPPGVPPVSAPNANQTTRERFLEHQKDSCATCHRVMDPAGFAFEGFDTVGRARDTENGKPIDASGTMATDKDLDGPFAGPVAFAQKLAASNDVRACVAKQWFRYAHGREDVDADAKSLNQLSCAFDKGPHSLRELLLALTQTDSFLNMPTGGGTP